MRRLLAVAVFALVLAAPARANGPSLFFLDARHGWASGHNALLGTSDGGRSWHVLRRTQRTLFSLQFADPRNGFAVDGDTLVRTRDGGRTWAPLRRHVIGFVRPWGITSRQELLRLGAGGTWARVRTPARPSSLCAGGESTLWLASAGRLFVTRDGGRTWRMPYVVKVKLGRNWSFWGGAVACRGSDIWALFTDGAATSQQAYVVAHSVDGGRTWTHPLAQSWFHVGQRASIDAYAGPYAVAPPGALFVGSCDPCGARGRITATTTLDGGRSFARALVAAQRGRWASAVALPDARHAFVAVASPRRGTIYATSDGGRHWRVSISSPLLRPTLT